MDNTKTRERLDGLPFKKASEYKSAQEDVRRFVWQKLESAKVLAELVERPEYKFWKEEFKAGLSCYDGVVDNDQLFQVFSEGMGIKVKVNQERVEKTPLGQNMVGVLVKSLSEAFSNTYFRAKGIIFEEQSLDAEKKPSKVSAKK